MTRITELDVHVVNVDHGDCIVVIGKSDDNPTFSMLIDGGRSGKISAKKLTDAIDFPLDPRSGEPVIDQLIASHHDSDHLGGLVKLLEAGVFKIRKAWIPVLFNPPGIPWMSASDQTTFSEDALEDPIRAQSNALIQIQSLARDALAYSDPNVSDDRLRELIMRHQTSSVGLSDRKADLETDTEHVDDEDVSRILDKAISSSKGADLTLLKELAQLGAQVPGVTGCGSFGDRDIPVEEFDGESDLDRQAKHVEMRRMERMWPDTPAEIQIHDKMFIAMMATRAAYNVGLTTDFISLCKAQGIGMVMPLTRRKKVRPHDIEEVAEGLSLTRLAPTYELVEEKKEQLMPPEGIYAFTALTHTVTVPNKVSYVFRLELNESSVLLTGDSGFTDFYNWRKKEFDLSRLEEMSKCQLVKVPHHGGHFEYWGKCVRKLLEESKPAGNIFVTSLGSAHKNPSLEFEQTAVLIRNADQGAEFHFTNPPVKERFDDICEECTTDVPEIISYSTIGDGNWILQTSAIQCKKYRV